MKQRCSWAGEDPLMIAYHDTEWGVPNYNDRKLFEFIILDAMQAGLSWQIILRKRATMKRAFANFDPAKVAKFKAADQKRLLNDPGIIRNRQKVAAAITNAQQFIRLQKQHGSFAKYLWGFVGGRPIQNAYSTDSQIPATSPESDAVSKALKAEGFKFVGSTICYAFMQGAGMVNDHTTDCFRYNQVNESA
jgi:DNA-3-methyladenine glycosylase I